MLILVNVVLSILFLGMILSAVYTAIEMVKLIHNPIPKMQNNDEKFLHIKNEYLHVIYSIKTR